MSKSKIKLPQEEVLAFAQYQALRDLRIMERAIRLSGSTKPELRRLVFIVEDFTEDIQAEIRKWLQVAKKTMNEDDGLFVEWQQQKNKFTY